MATLTSNKVAVNATPEVVYKFISNLNNIEQLLPQDRVVNWDSTNDTCSFTIKGLAGISMKLGICEPYTNVHLDSYGKNPFDFTLNVHISETETGCEAQIVFDGNMNFMLQTLASTPLTNLFNMMTKKLAERFNPPV
ncbi:MAG: hypothetical protein KDC83_11980 [Flavobacteriales bacterium]|nr:hypothetical protein [Flavobacteriales bacterium]